MCIHRLGSLAHGYGALEANCPSPAGHATEQFQHGTDPLSELPIRPDFTKCVQVQHPEAQDPEQDEVRQLAQRLALCSSSA
jgi:hypothetical protein